MGLVQRACHAMPAAILRPARPPPMYKQLAVYSTVGAGCC